MEQMMSLLHNVKIKIDEHGKGEVSLDGKQLATTGTRVIAHNSEVVTRANQSPEVTIYTFAETLDQEIVTDNVTIHEVETCLRIWAFEDAPEEYKTLSKNQWKEAYILRMPRGHDKARRGLLISDVYDMSIDHRWQKWCDSREHYELDSGYDITIWGWTDHK